MSAMWLTTLSVYAASFVWAIWREVRGRYALAIHAAFWMAFVQLFLYYDPAVSAHAYEWFTLAAKGLASAIDCGLAVGILWRWRASSTLELTTLLLILCHQRVKLDWIWAADMFRLPVGAEASLNTLAFASNLACSLAFILILHQGETHAEVYR